MNIKSDKLILFTGKNGSGKSTFSKILTGDLYINNREKFILNSPKKTFYYNQNIEDNIFSELTVKEHLNIFNKKGLIKMEVLYEYFPFLVTHLNKYPDELSGGQNQLLGFCTLLAKHFDLIIFDEIINHLDANNIEIVLKMIKNELVNKLNMSIIIISHQNELMEEYIDIEYQFLDGLMEEVKKS